MKIKAPDITATGVLAIAGIAVAAYVVWRGSKSVRAIVDYVAEIPAAIKNNLETHGSAFEQSYTPQPVADQTLSGRVYADPFMTDDGMSFSPLWGLSG
jgi:hypothetical protein